MRHSTIGLNYRSGVALAMCHRHSSVPYGLSGLWQGDEHPAYGPGLWYVYFTLIQLFIGI